MSKTEAKSAGVSVSGYQVVISSISIGVEGEHTTQRQADSWSFQNIELAR